MAAAAAQRRTNGTVSAKGMSKPVVYSLAFHACVILLAIVGIPIIAPQTPVVEPPIPVEVMTISDKARVTRPAASPQPMDIARKAEPKEPPRPVPPTSTAREPPKPTPPAKPPEPSKSEAAPEPAEDALAPPEKILKKVVKPVKKPAKPMLTEAKQEEDQSEQMSALLKNLIQSEPAPSAQDAPAADAEPVPDAEVGTEMTADEWKAVTDQLAACWKLLAGARYAEDLVVKISMTIGPDRKVQSAQITDQVRYNADSFYRAAADSALRAVYDPHCTPLDLPQDKYDQWKDLTVNFDPREMLQ